MTAVEPVTRDVFTTRPGTVEYAGIIGQIRTDDELLARMWADAEHRVDDLDQPGVIWTVAMVRTGWRKWTPAGWACSREIVENGQRVLKCFGNYEHPDWRGHGLYAAAYRLRHEQVVQPAGLPAVTYLFGPPPDRYGREANTGPIPLHEADGWYRTGENGPGELDGHWWWELRRDPS